MGVLSAASGVDAAAGTLGDWVADVGARLTTISCWVAVYDAPASGGPDCWGWLSAEGLACLMGLLAVMPA